jgi:hypothetical protein
MINNVLNSFVANSKSIKTVEIFAQSLVKTEAVKMESHLGSGDLKTEVTEAISNAKGHDTLLRNSVSRTKMQLDDIYTIKQGRVKKVFYLCLITVAVSVILLIAGLIIIFVEQNIKKQGIILSVSSVFTTFLGATIFFMYKKENENLKDIETDLIKIRKLEDFFNIVNQIQGDEEKKKAYSNIIEQMKL